MSDLLAEGLISFTEAAKFFPGLYEGTHVNLATIYRWSNYGCRGVKLEWIQSGARRCTSKPALKRFMNELSKPENLDAFSAELQRRYELGQKRSKAATRKTKRRVRA